MEEGARDKPTSHIHQPTEQAPYQSLLRLSPSCGLRPRTRGLKGPPPSARVSDVLTACQEGRAPAAGSKWPLLRRSSRGRTELQSRRTQGRPPGPCAWGLLARAYPLRGARASPWRGALVWCARMAARALHALARLREEGRAGVGEYTLSYPSLVI